MTSESAVISSQTSVFSVKTEEGIAVPWLWPMVTEKIPLSSGTTVWLLPEPEV